MHFYEVKTDDGRYADQWFLSEPLTSDGVQVDAREFRYGKPYVGPAPALVPIQYEGRLVAFTLAAFDMPVVTTEIAEILEELAPADIERFPVMIGTYIEGYEIVNVVSTRRCLDESRSLFRKWGPDDGRPDKVGEYLEIEKLVIDPSRTRGSRLFRIWGSIIELIVTDDVKKALQDTPDLGVVFEPIESSS